MKIKYFVALFLFVSVLFLAPSAKAALSASDLQAQIQALLEQIKTLQAQLDQMQGDGTTQWCHTFTQSLKIGDSGDEVSALHTALTKEGFTDTSWRADNFTEVTASAVVEFQEKYASDILTTAGLKHGTGFVGGATKKKLNALYGCKIAPPLPLPTSECKIDSDCLGRVVPLVCTSNLDGSASCPKSPNKCDKGRCVWAPDENLDCKTLWWHDNTNKTCSQKQFCGAFMYFGLKTFATELACKADLNISTTQPSITVTSPNGGENWKVGETHSITWTSIVVPQNGFDIFLYDESAGYECGNKKIADNVLPSNSSNQYAYSWNTKTLINPGSISMCGPSGDITTGKYKILIVNGDDSHISDYSNNYFTITSATTTCVPNWQCQWGTCTSGYQSQTAVDLNNCGTTTYATACTALARQCPTIRPSITVTSPNGGEVWKTNEIKDITWTVNDALLETLKKYPNSKFSIGLSVESSSGSTGIGNVAVDIDPKVGKYSWIVGSYTDYSGSGKYASSGSNYKISLFVTDLSNGVMVTDFSNSVFSIASGDTYRDPIITFPSAGSTLIPGKTYNITWTGTDVGVSEYSVYLIGGSLGNTGSKFLGVAYTSQKTFSWTVPLDITAGSGYMIQLSGAGATGNNSSSFSIASAITQPPASTQPSITVISPNGGETWKVGETHNITWNSVGFAPGMKVNIGLNGDGITSTMSGAGIVIGVLASTGKYSWTIPSWLGENLVGKKYSIYVAPDVGQGDSSDNYFSIAPAVSNETSSHMQCQNQRCVAVSGAGTNQCSTDGDCAVCAPIWQCTDYSACNGYTQSRTCTDTNNCNNNQYKPSESRQCTTSLLDMQKQLASIAQSVLDLIKLKK